MPEADFVPFLSNPSDRYPGLALGAKPKPKFPGVFGKPCDLANFLQCAGSMTYTTFAGFKTFSILNYLCLTPSSQLNNLRASPSPLVISGPIVPGPQTDVDRSYRLLPFSSVLAGEAIQKPTHAFPYRPPSVEVQRA